MYSLSGTKPFVGDHIEEKICKGSYNITNLLFSNISNGAQDVIKQLLIVDLIKRLDFDKVLKHSWFEKDTLMKQKVNNLIVDFSNNLKSSNMPFSEENVTKKIKLCPCLTRGTCSDAQCN